LIGGGGLIGKAVARRAAGFYTRVLYWTPRRKPEQEEREAGLTFAALDSLLRESDFVSLHSPLNPSTRHQIGARELKLMKKTAYPINTARGPIVDEAALIRALRTKQIAGAGLDVFEYEPKVGKELRKLNNVVLTPHRPRAAPGRRPQLIAERRCACKPAHQPLSNAAIFVGTVRQKLVITEWHHP
jgi:glyoxylate reductase